MHQSFFPSYWSRSQDVIICSYRGVEEVHGVAVEEEERDDDGGGHDGAPEHVLRSRSLHSLGKEFHLVQSKSNWIKFNLWGPSINWHASMKSANF